MKEDYLAAVCALALAAGGCGLQDKPMSAPRTASVERSVLEVTLENGDTAIGLQHGELRRADIFNDESEQGPLRFSLDTGGLSFLYDGDQVIRAINPGNRYNAEMTNLRAGRPMRIVDYDGDGKAGSRRAEKVGTIRFAATYYDEGHVAKRFCYGSQVYGVR